MTEAFEPLPWWRDALCAELGPDLFFLRDGEPGHEAKRACQLCGVRLNCLADAAAAGVEHGIFGGLGIASRQPLTQQIRDGADPIEVAQAAIDDERKKRERGPADRRRGTGKRGRRGDRLRAVAAGREEERAAVAAHGAHPARQ